MRIGRNRRLVASPLTTSTKAMRSAGEKKCRPRNRPGSLNACASPLIARPEVLLAINVSRGAAASIRRSTLVFVLAILVDGFDDDFAAAERMVAFRRFDARENLGADRVLRADRAQPAAPMRRAAVADQPEPPPRSDRTTRPSTPKPQRPARFRGPSGPDRRFRRTAPPSAAQEWKWTAWSISARPTRAALALACGSS